MNLVDLFVIALALLAAARGWRSGLLGQIFELGGGFLGLLLGVALGPRVASFFTDQAGIQAMLISLLVVFVLLSIGQTVGFLLGHRFGQVISGAKLGRLNSGLGAGFGIVVTLVSFWLIGSTLVHGPSRSIAKAMQKSTLLKAVTDVMPRPPDLFAYLRQYLQTSGFPQVFVGFPRLGPPVDLPPRATAQRAIRAADQSTVRVIAPACGATQLGSGWVAADSTIVTNAHVVAGGDEITVQQQSGSDVTGTVVLFDPRTDVAVIHAVGLTGPPLPLETAPQDRGTPGATLGYPGHAGGVLVTHAAAVQATYEAVGKDIYGRANVNRDIYELRSPVRQGDSGGPFVLPNGEVAGVVFAASTTESGTGYALTGAEVEDEIDRGKTRTEPVNTGGCTH